MSSNRLIIHVLRYARFTDQSRISASFPRCCAPSLTFTNETNEQTKQQIPNTPAPCFLHQLQPSAMTRWQPTQCPVCRRLLVHRAGAAIIHCPSCHSLLNLHAHPSTPGQTLCVNCANIIHHPIGPPLLQCRMCSTTNSTPILNYICRVCSVYLVYSSTLTAVVCPICHNVEPPIDTPLSHIPLLLPLTHHAPPRPCPSLPPRHIPWLPSTPVRPVTAVPRPSQQFRSSPPPQPPVFPTPTQPSPSTADTLSVNGAHHQPDNQTQHDIAKPVSEPLTISPPPKSKQEHHFDTKD